MSSSFFTPLSLMYHSHPLWTALVALNDSLFYQTEKFCPLLRSQDACLPEQMFNYPVLKCLLKQLYLLLLFFNRLFVRMPSRKQVYQFYLPCSYKSALTVNKSVKPVLFRGKPGNLLTAQVQFLID